MKTLLTESAREAAAVCRAGRAVAFPTETVYGLGARISDEAAIREIYSIKGRPSANPLIAHITNADDFAQYAADIPDFAARLIERFVPGPITFVFNRRHEVPPFAFGGLGTIAIRVPAHDVAREFISDVGEAVVAPSANRSGKPSPTRWQDVEQDFGDRCACILIGDPAVRGLESTVIDCTGAAPVVLRPGSVTVDDLRSIVPATAYTSQADLLARSPGTRFRHYAPRAQVLLVDAPPEKPLPSSVYIGLDAPPSPEQWLHAFICNNLDQYGANLYRALRDADSHGARQIYCQRVPRRGLGVAIMDRLERAASAHP